MPRGLGAATSEIDAQATEELGGEPKLLRPETEEYLAQLDWPGNVRQLENTCRWLTVMASGREIHVGDLPPELRRGESAAQQTTDWEQALRNWADQELARFRDGTSAPLLDVIGICAKSSSE